MDLNRRQAIWQVAESLFDELGLSCPVDLRAVVDRIHGQVEFTEKDEDVDGSVRPLGRSGFIISIPMDQRPARQRFSIAHELGHLFLHMGFTEPERWAKAKEYKDSVRYRYGYTEEELEANQFAGALLMPSQLFFRKVSELKGQNGLTPGQLQAVADSFGVSTDAVLTRGRWLGMFPWP